MKKNYSNLYKLCASIGLVALSTNQVNAAQDLIVSATVPSVCVISTPGSALTMNFGTLAIETPGAAVFTQTTAFKWRCSVGTTGQIAIANGAGGGTIGSRLMTDGSNTLGYTLKTPSSTAWGDGNSGTVTVDAVGAGLSSGNEQTTNIVGEIVRTDAEVAPQGVYTETVSITLTF